VALVGDLTAQHDLTALAAAAGRDIVVVVINNGGGGIFGYLPVAALPEFERAWLTPQRSIWSPPRAASASPASAPGHWPSSRPASSGHYCAVVRR
jgi:2-succinyl-5-enolpyruvyl-6-hydroxy-3-cyclohexene-1-carboxylate synthase